MSQIIDDGDKLKLVKDFEAIQFVLKSKATVQGQPSSTAPIPGTVQIGQVVIFRDGVEIFREDQNNIFTPSPFTDLTDLICQIQDLIDDSPTPLVNTAQEGHIFNSNTNTTGLSTLTIGIAGLNSKAKSDDDSVLIEWNSTLSIDITSSGVGGLEEGLTEAIDTWYAVFAIADSSGINPTVGMLSDKQTPILPNGYNKYRRVGWVRNNGASNFIPVMYSGSGVRKKSYYTNSIASNLVISFGSSIVPTLVSIAAFMPPTSDEVSVAAYFDSAIAANVFQIRDAGNAIYTHLGVNGNFSGSALGQSHFLEIMTSPNQEIEYEVSSILDNFSIGIHAFMDNL